MRYLRYFGIALIAGLGFGAGAVLVLIFVVPKIGDYEIEEMHRDRISSEERKIGMSCTDLYQATIDFSQREISRAIAVGRSGGDWVAAFRSEQREYISESANNLLSCQLLSFQARELGIEWPSFEGLSELYSALRIFTTSYSDKPPSAGSLKPEAFQKVISLHQNVTRRSTTRLTAPDSPNAASPQAAG